MSKGFYVLNFIEIGRIFAKIWDFTESVYSQILYSYAYKSKKHVYGVNAAYLNFYLSYRWFRYIS